MLIAGDLVEAEGGECFQAGNPLREEVLASVPLTNRENVERAVAAGKPAKTERRRERRIIWCLLKPQSTADRLVDVAWQSAAHQKD